MWGRNSPERHWKPHTCTLRRKVWLFGNGGCTITDIGGREKRQVEGCLKLCEALGPNDEISGFVEAVSFDDTLGEIEKVLLGDLSEDRTILVNSVCK